MDKTLDWQIIGRNLSFFRFISQISREDLAMRLGMSVQQLSRLEKGMEEFTINLVVTAALALGTQPYVLLAGTHALDLGEANRRYQEALRNLFADLNAKTLLKSDKAARQTE